MFKDHFGSWIFNAGRTNASFKKGVVHLECVSWLIAPKTLSIAAVDALIGDVRTALSEHNAAAMQLLIESNTALQTTKERNFTEHLFNISKNTQMTQNLSANIEDTLKRVRNLFLHTFNVRQNAICILIVLRAGRSEIFVCLVVIFIFSESKVSLCWQIYSQLFVARELEFPLKTKETNFTKIQELYNHTHVQFMDAIEQVYNYSQEIQATLEKTKVTNNLNFKE